MSGNVSGKDQKSLTCSGTEACSKKRESCDPGSPLLSIAPFDAAVHMFRGEPLRFYLNMTGSASVIFIDNPETCSIVPAFRNIWVGWTVSSSS